MIVDEREKWDERYGVPEYIFGREPSRFLVENQEHLPERGHALDIATGEGKNAVYLAEIGLQVRAVDISSVGLEKTGRLARQREVRLETQLTDLKRVGLPPGPYDVIICMHYLQRDLARPISANLTCGGILLMELNTVDNIKLHRRPPREFLLEKNELKTWFPSLEIVKYREGIFEGYAVAQLVARRGG